MTIPFPLRKLSRVVVSGPAWNSWQTLWVRDEYLNRIHSNAQTNYIYSIRALKNFDTWENHGILIMRLSGKRPDQTVWLQPSSHSAVAIFDQYNNIISSVSYNNLNVFRFPHRRGPNMRAHT